jgi:hypothetical protein
VWLVVGGGEWGVGSGEWSGEERWSGGKVGTDVGRSPDSGSTVGCRRFAPFKTRLGAELVKMGCRILFGQPRAMCSRLERALCLVHSVCAERAEQSHTHVNSQGARRAD